MIIINFAENLKRLRLERGLTQAEVARKLKMSYQTYNGYETKGREPKLELLIDIAFILGVSVDELLNYNMNDTTQLIYKEYLEKIKSYGFDIEDNNEEIILKYKNTFELPFSKSIFMKFMEQNLRKAEKITKPILDRTTKEIIKETVLEKMLDKEKLNKTIREALAKK